MAGEVFREQEEAYRGGCGDRGSQGALQRT